MDAFLGTITQHAMNYAIRSGIGITASYAIRQSSRLLKTIDDNADYQELHSLQEKLNGKIKIISPAIDMIELISARGNTTLESAVTLTKTLRWDIQSLGVRLAKAATAEEASRRKSSRVKTRATHKREIQEIVQDIRNLLTRIEDAVPLINLAITTSGASLSTTLPATVSPSRLLQASTFLTAGDTQYSMNPSVSVQVGPAFTLSLYMLFAGHAYRANSDEDTVRGTTWKEVIHKARVKLMRIPLRSKLDFHENNSSRTVLNSVENEEGSSPIMTGERRQNEYAYHLEIIEDQDDDRVHSFEEGDPQPGLYGDVLLAGIRECLPIYQISKIFYADTGKILNIGSQGETNNPVLLLKRDINALPPRRMMQENERESSWFEDHEEQEQSEGEENPQYNTDGKTRRESLDSVTEEEAERSPLKSQDPLENTAWRLPSDLDPEWLALEVYTEIRDSSIDDEQDSDDATYNSQWPSSLGEAQDNDILADGIANINLNQNSSPVSSSARQLSSNHQFTNFSSPKPSYFGPIMSSLSLLEMLIRLTALQQFQQASHLAIPDELLTFFLEESSTTGAGGDSEVRRRTRSEARRKVGFDPYDESPIKKRGEDYQYQNQGQECYENSSRGATPYEDYDQQGLYPESPSWAREQRVVPQGTPEQWLLRGREVSTGSNRNTPDFPPSSPIPQHRKPSRHLDRLNQGRSAVRGSPLGRGMSADTDSSLGTSPGSPTLVDRVNKNEKI